MKSDTSLVVFQGLGLMVALAVVAPSAIYSQSTKSATLENLDGTVAVTESLPGIVFADRTTHRTWPLNLPCLQTGTNPPVCAVSMHIVASSGKEITFQTDLPGIAFRVAVHPDAPGFDYTCEWEKGTAVSDVTLLTGAWPLEAKDKGYYAIPKSLGIQVRPEDGKEYHTNFEAYNHSTGYSMAMYGVVSNGSAVLVDWSSPETEFSIDHVMREAGYRLTINMKLHAPAHGVHVQLLGDQNYVGIAKAYRGVAERRGLVMTLAQKSAQNPLIEKLIGAADFKPLVYIQRLAKDGSGRVATRMPFSFAETADMAEHYKNDLGIDRAMLIESGWIREGYDNQHPDILPAAAPPGGNEGLTAAADKIKAAGWLFGLHDNYQDMYAKAPSFNEKFLIERLDGTRMKGGVWAGGQSYLICSKESIKLIDRPQNFPEVQSLFAPTVYFLDTVFSAKLRVCVDPDHPTTKNDDMIARQKLCDYVRERGVLFGTEEGNEIGIAHADYFEGMLSQKTRSHIATADIVIPLFEMVYGDSIQIMTHQADKLGPDMADQFLDHVLYAEMPVYDYGEHEYWLHPSEPPALSGDAAAASAKQPNSGIFGTGANPYRLDQFIKNSYEVLSWLNRLTSTMVMTDQRYLTPDRLVEQTMFGSGVTITVNHGSTPFTIRDTVLPQYGFLVDSPSFEAFFASKWHGQVFRSPTFAAIRTLDGRSIAASKQVHVYRGFGDSAILIRGKPVPYEVH